MVVVPVLVEMLWLATEVVEVDEEAVDLVEVVLVVARDERPVGVVRRR